MKECYQRSNLLMKECFQRSKCTLRSCMPILKDAHEWWASCSGQSTRPWQFLLAKIWCLGSKKMLFGEQGWCCSGVTTLGCRQFQSFERQMWKKKRMKNVSKQPPAYLQQPPDFRKQAHAAFTWKLLISAYVNNNSPAFAHLTTTSLKKLWTQPAYRKQPIQ